MTVETSVYGIPLTVESEGSARRARVNIPAIFPLSNHQEATMFTGLLICKALLIMAGLSMVALIAYTVSEYFED